MRLSGNRSSCYASVAERQLDDLDATCALRRVDCEEYLTSGRARSKVGEVFSCRENLVSGGDNSLNCLN